MGGLELRKACEARLRALDLPISAPVDPAGFCAQLARRRGRPIVISALPAMGAGHACGLWVVTGDRDIILVEQATSRRHQDHIIAHELGHLIFDHYAELDSRHAFLADLLPDLTPALVERVLGRSAYTARQEQEAEVFASVLMTWAPAATTTPVDAPDSVTRFASALEPDGVWRG
jgi:hypothetical protein